MFCVQCVYACAHVDAIISFFVVVVSFVRQNRENYNFTLVPIPYTPMHTWRTQMCVCVFVYSVAHCIWIPYYSVVHINT